MVSATTTILAAVLGFLVYVAVPVSAVSAPVEWRKKIGTFYFKLGTRALKQFTLVRRVLSGYDVKPINVDNEQKLLKVTLSSSTLGDDEEYRFADPDNRVMRLFNRPIALAYEKVPAAVDAELSEWGHWAIEKKNEEGLVVEDAGEEKVDPYVEASDEMRLVDPVDVFALVPNNVDPENIKTTEKLTEKRFEKYGSGVGLKESLRVMIGFAVGMGGVVGVRYVNEEMIDGGGGGPPGSGIVGNETLQAAIDPGIVMDMAVTVL